MPDLKSNDKIITECKVGLKTRERYWLIFAAVSVSFAVSGQHGIGAGGECGELAVNVEKGPTVHWSNVVTTAAPPFLHVINDPFVHGFPPWLLCMCVCLCVCACVFQLQ